MRVPPFFTFGAGYCSNSAKLHPNKGYLKLMGYDTVAFSSTAKYLKKYVTLPDEIKKTLTPKDAIDMFKDMEMVASGAKKRKDIGQGGYSKVYKNPWLKDYYLLVLNDTNYDTQIIYSNNKLGDAVWQDSTDPRVQLIKKAA